MSFANETPRSYTAAFTGFRPKKLPRNTDYDALFLKMRDIIEQSINQGYTEYMSGMAAGIDIKAAELVLELKEAYPQIRLHCVLPCLEQDEGWSEKWRQRHKRILAAADKTTCLQEKYTKDCMMRRNRFLVDNCSRLIAVYDGIISGGTSLTVNYARKKNVEIVMLNPMDYNLVTLE